jgi:tetratricopeptide (TPR) repeat protein
MRTDFVGRQEELAWLRSQFDACATQGPDGNYGGPRMAFVIAESGIGKSRLVQELYVQLTGDPQWDPPEVDYWPDAFKASGQELHVVPDMKGHEAKGPPRFAWLGGRWHPTNERNVRARKSILPELRSSLTVHAEILRAHQSLWQDAAGRLAGAVRQEGTGEVISQLADSAFPFGGLLLKLASGIKEITIDRHAGPKDYDELAKRNMLSDVDEVLDSFRLLLNAKSAVPAVLWLDDAQWIDSDTLVFIERLWSEAMRRQWPLLVIVTHWEREWREMAVSGGGNSLQCYSGSPGVGELLLRSPPGAMLKQCLKARLPGLTDQQVSLMIKKAAGNFLQLLENIGAVSSRSRNFVDRTPLSPLTEDAEALIRKYETDRERRVAQRFQEFEEDVQDVLGWSSQFGQRFLKEVVESFAKERLGSDSTGELIERCVDPYVVLDRSSPFTREFRDKVFHKVADDYRHQYLLKDADGLSVVLRTHLVEWVLNSVTPDGEIVSQPADFGGMPHRSLTFLPEGEKRDLLGIALEELRLPVAPDWSNVEHRAALLAICLSVDTDSHDKLWTRVGFHLDRLRGVDWTTLPFSVLGRGVRERIIESAGKAGRLQVKHHLVESIVSLNRGLAGEQETPERLRALSASLHTLGYIKRTLDQVEEAIAVHEEALAIGRRIVTEPTDPADLDAFVTQLFKLGCYEESQGRNAKATARYEECLAACELYRTFEATADQLAQVVAIKKYVASRKPGSAASDQSPSITERIASLRSILATGESPEVLDKLRSELLVSGLVDGHHGRIQESLKQHKEALLVSQRLWADEELPERLANIGFALKCIAQTCLEQEQYDEAFTRFEEALMIARRLWGEESTWGRAEELADCLEGMADADRGCERYDAAIEKYQEALAVFQQSPQHGKRFERDERRGSILRRLASAFLLSNQDEEASRHFQQSLDIARSLVRVGETPSRLEECVRCILGLLCGKACCGEYELVVTLCEELLACFGQLGDARVRAHLIPALRLLREIGEPLAGEAGDLAVLELTTRFVNYVVGLSESGCDDTDCLQACAAFWELRLVAAEATGKAMLVSEASHKAAALRLRIAELGEDGSHECA